MESNYKSFTKRINKAQTKADLEKLAVSLDRLYDSGIFTESELQRLDHKIMEAGL